MPRPRLLVALALACGLAGACAHPLTRPRAYHEAATLGDGSVLILGGAGYPPPSLVGRYDPEDRSWKMAAPLPAGGRSWASATALLDGRALVAGGTGTEVEPLRSAILYDPLADRWRDAAPMSRPRANHAAARLADGRVLVVAGDDDDGDVGVEIYDPSADRWREASPLPHAGRRLSATTLVDGRVIVVGEIDAPEPIALVYDPRADAWGTTGRLAEARAFHAAIALGDGGLAVVGGRVVIGGELRPRALASVELLDPRSLTWRPGPRLCHARSGHTATLLGDRLLVIGGAPSGWGAERAVAQAELLDLSAATTRVLGRIVGPRSSHTASALPDGDVLVVGGRRRILFNTWERRFARRLSIGERASGGWSPDEVSARCPEEGRRP
ncbi:MAG: hypothetical protein H6711_15240 [Myxococcales bacterium]|nr:hypothetical protein [Myxococcales bacterium]